MPLSPSACPRPPTPAREAGNTANTAASEAASRALRERVGGLPARIEALKERVDAPGSERLSEIRRRFEETLGSLLEAKKARRSQENFQSGGATGSSLGLSKPAVTPSVGGQPVGGQPAPRQSKENSELARIEVL